MKVGITYDLREDYLKLGFGKEETAELDSPATIAGIDEALRQLGYQTERIGNLLALTRRLLSGERWDLVFNIAEGFYGVGRESQVPALLDAFQVPYTFSDPLVLALALHKGMAKHVIRDLGVPTPDFAVVDRIEEAAAVDLPYPLFAKPVAEGTSKGIAADSKISSLEELQSVCRRLLTTYRQSVLVEVFLPGREFTVGVVGTGRQARCVGVLEVTLKGAAEPEAYSYSNKVFYEDRVQYRLAVDPTARKAAEVALAAWRGLGCRDGGRVDLRCAADGSVHFIEVNPLAGLNPVWSDLPILCRLAGMEYVELIDAIMRSALDRVDRKGEDNVA